MRVCYLMATNDRTEREALEAIAGCTCDAAGGHALACARVWGAPEATPAPPQCPEAPPDGGTEPGGGGTPARGLPVAAAGVRS